MHQELIAVAIFGALVTSSFASQYFYHKFPARLRESDTHDYIKQVASLFAVLTALVLGLATNSAKNTLESVDRNVHSFATNLVLLDRTLQQYGAEATETRKRLLAYTQRAAATAHETRAGSSDPISETLLNDVGTSLKAINPGSADRLLIWNDALSQYRKCVELRWILVEQSEGTIPAPLIILLVIWLMLIFASFRYRAPRNMIVTGTSIVAAALMAATIYLILDMDVPFSGLIQVSSAPMERAVTEMNR